MKKIILCVIMSLFLSGCAGNLSPFSPRAQQRIQNQGKIDDIKTAQDAIVKEVGQLRNDVKGNDNKVQSTTGTANSANTGLQILSGDGAIVVIFCIVLVGIMGIVYYRVQALNHEKAVGIITQQVAMHGNPELNDNILRAAMNTPVESLVYHALTKQKLYRRD